MTSNSGKVRPQTPEGLAAALEGGNLDGRTWPMKLLREVETALSEDPGEASRAILTHALGVNLSIQRAILEHALKHPETLVSDDGQLTPLVAVDLPKVQARINQALSQLRQLSGGDSGSGNKEPTLADMVGTAEEDQS